MQFTFNSVFSFLAVNIDVNYHQRQDVGRCDAGNREERDIDDEGGLVLPHVEMGGRSPSDLFRFTCD